MKKTCLLILWSLAMGATGMAQQTSKVAIIHPQKIFENSIEGKKAASQLQEKSQQLQKELSKKDDQIRTLETKLNTQRLTLSEEALTLLQSDYQKAATERKRMEEDATRDFETLKNRLLTKFKDEILQMVESVAKDKGFDMVLDASGGAVVFFLPAVDITEEVVKRYNAKQPLK